MLPVNELVISVEQRQPQPYPVTVDKSTTDMMGVIVVWVFNVLPVAVLMESVLQQPPQPCQVIVVKSIIET